MAAGTRPELLARLGALRRLRPVPDDVLAAAVLTRGLFWQVPSEAEVTAIAQAADPDRALAARLCAGCPVLDECLELDLRTAGGRTVGVLAGLPDSDRRALYPLWATERESPGPPGDPPTGAADE